MITYKVYFNDPYNASRQKVEVAEYRSDNELTYDEVIDATFGDIESFIVNEIENMEFADDDEYNFDAEWLKLSENIYVLDDAHGILEM